MTIWAAVTKFSETLNVTGDLVAIMTLGFQSLEVSRSTNEGLIEAANFGWLAGNVASGDTWFGIEKNVATIWATETPASTAWDAETKDALG